MASDPLVKLLRAAEADKTNDLIQKVYIFNDWSSENIGQIQRDLDRLRHLSGNVVVLVDLDGSRGVDYMFLDYTPAHVILAFTPNKLEYGLLFQALSRGCRNFQKHCEGTLVVEKEQWEINFGIGAGHEESVK